MKHIVYTLFALTILLGVSCTKENPLGDTSKYISSVSADASDNAMRATITPVFSSDCQWSVKYWVTEEGEKTAKTTRTYSSAEKSELTLLFLSCATKYSYRLVADNKTSEVFNFTTIEKPEGLYNFQVTETNAGDEWLDGYLLQTDALDGMVSFCDYDGKTVWYHHYASVVEVAHYNGKYGLLTLLVKNPNGNSDGNIHLLVSDLNGKILLDKVGTEDFAIYMHHECRLTDDGTIVIVNRHSKIINEIEYAGEEILACDLQGNAIFRWNNFDTINPTTAPYIVYNPLGRDYLHANSADKDSAGDYYITLNNLDEVVKVDGKTGKAIYRFGTHGDITLSGATPKNYHSEYDPSKFITGGLHAAFALEPDRILFLNNGKNELTSKAILVKIDPSTKTANYELMIDFEKKYYTPDRSNVQILPNGGIMLSSAPLGLVVFCNSEGKTMRVITRMGNSYRGIWYSSEDLAF